MFNKRLIIKKASRKGVKKVSAKSSQPLPVVWIIVTVLMFNFLGDGLRDAADPYK